MMPSPGLEMRAERHHAMAVDGEQWLHMYRQMLRIRRFEEQVNELYMSAKMPGLAHLYIGQEAVAVGVCEALRRDDYITSTHRGHGHCLAKGASMDRMFAELLGKAPGYNRGKGGSMHIADPDTGNLGANAIVAGAVGIATGAAFSAKMRGTDQVAVCFFGEGALGQGVLYEVMNMASLWKLPVIYVCENNLYTEYTPYQEVLAGEILDRPRAFGIHAEAVDGQDVRAVYFAARRLVERARAGEGPAFLLCQTYRYYGHHVGDIDRSYYRPREEEEFWKKERDPIRLLGTWLLQERLADERILEAIAREVQAEVEAALAFALNAPYPIPDEVAQHVYADKAEP
ncbi:MAG TPA: thiamine pyrophosphate-dependent dehydrogenase E1 component subunit alpha [Thermoflexus sp.]|nr:thiamine pyrophosphate-dependent dehydrogenase E1 component subunit alpha [Thermoflexus sp.]